MAEWDIGPKTTVSELVAAYPAAIRIFEALHIDYCDGGRRRVEEVAGQARMPAEALLAVLRTTIAQARLAPYTEFNWQRASLDDLTAHIVERHHDVMRRELPRLREAMARVVHVHAATHGTMLTTLAETFDALKQLLEQHLQYEEEVTFPAIRRLPHGEYDASARETLDSLEREHEDVARLLSRLRALSEQYQPPTDAGSTLRALYESLQALERDLHQHIHLEQHILFPRVRRIAVSRGEAA